MPANDAIVLRNHFEQWEKQAGKLPVQPWLYYCLSQFLKPYSLDGDEIAFGITDGANDGGNDGIYFLVNQRQLVMDDTELDPKSVSKVRLIFFQVKTSGGMKPTEIEKWLTSSADFFALAKRPDQFGDRYNQAVKSMMGLWRDQYLRIVNSFPDLCIDYYYITGDDAEPDEYALDSCKRVKELTVSLTKATCEVRCIGAEELWQQVQVRPPKSKSLKWSDQPMSAEEGYVGLVTLQNFKDFLEDRPGVLAERIFESNVRGYLQDTTVNEDISRSLETRGGPNFWLLNNGVTIIASRAAPAGHLILSVEDPQIVNGLQTSRRIFQYFHQNPNKADVRNVLVRVIPTTDQTVQDEIIAATNNQNKMPAASLRMTDQIHRDIEEFFKKVDLFYDRRRGFYRDQGKPIRKIISVNAVAQAIISMLLQRPDEARARPGDYFKDDDKYKSVFANPKFGLPAYLHCIQIMQAVEEFLDDQIGDAGLKKNLKFYVAALAVREATGIRVPPVGRLPAAHNLDKLLLEACLNTVARIYVNLLDYADGDAVARGPQLLKRLDSAWARKQAKVRRAKGRK